MKPADFRAWRAYMSLTQAAAAKALDISLAMVKLYERGEDYARVDERGRPKKIVIPKTVELACFFMIQNAGPCLPLDFPPIGAELERRAGKKRRR